MAGAPQRNPPPGSTPFAKSSPNDASPKQKRPPNDSAGVLGMVDQPIRPRRFAARRGPNSRRDGLAGDGIDVATADADITEFAVAHLREFATRFTNATPCAELLGDSSERRHDRQPITKTIQIRSSSLVNGMYLKGAGSSSSGVLSDGASLSFL